MSADLVLVGGEWMLDENDVDRYVFRAPLDHEARWSGGVVPRLTLPQVQRLVVEQREIADAYPEDSHVLTLNEDGTLLVEFPGHEDRLIEPDADGLYSIRLGWSWGVIDEADLAPTTEVVEPGEVGR